MTLEAANKLGAILPLLHRESVSERRLHRQPRVASVLIDGPGGAPLREVDQDAYGVELRVPSELGVVDWRVGELVVRADESNARPQRLLAAFFTDLFAADFFVAFFFVAFTFRVRAPRALVVPARRRVLALAFLRFAALTVALLVPAFFVAVRFGVPVRLIGALVFVLAGFFATTRRFEAAVRFRFDDFEDRIGWRVRART
jgi:hypothetical protein